MDSNKQMEKLGRVIRMIIDGEATFFEDKEISVILADFAYKKERYIQKVCSWIIKHDSDSISRRIWIRYCSL